MTTLQEAQVMQGMGTDLVKNIITDLLKNIDWKLILGQLADSGKVALLAFVQDIKVKVKDWDLGLTGAILKPILDAIITQIEKILLG